MRAALLLVVAGCDVVFHLEGPTAVISEAAMPVDGTGNLSISRPPAVTDGAALIVAITTTPADATLTTAPPGWTPIWDDVSNASCVTARRHTIIYSGIAAPDETIYLFELANAIDVGALFFAYGGASAPVPRKLDAVINGGAAPKPIPLPGAELRPASIDLLIVNCANNCGARLFEPTTEQTLSFGTELFGFELSTSGSVPDRMATLPNNTCAHLAELTIEPD